MCSILCNSHHTCWDTCQSGISVKALVVQWRSCRQSQCLNSILTSLSVWKCRLWKALLNFGEWVEIQWCQIRAIGKMLRNLQVPSIQEVPTLPYHRFCLTIASQYSKWIPTHSCILHKKNTLQFTLFPLSTLSLWSPLFNLHCAWVVCASEHSYHFIAWISF